VVEGALEVAEIEGLICGGSRVSGMRLGEEIEWRERSKFGVENEARERLYLQLRVCVVGARGGHPLRRRFERRRGKVGCAGGRRRLSEAKERAGAGKGGGDGS
jgi:hypothetical protein